MSINPKFKEDVESALEKIKKCDWGIADNKIKKNNDIILQNIEENNCRNGSKIVGVYNTSKEAIAITITIEGNHKQAVVTAYSTYQYHKNHMTIDDGAGKPRQMQQNVSRRWFGR